MINIFTSLEEIITEDDIKLFGYIYGEKTYNEYIKNIEKNNFKDGIINLFRINEEIEIIKEICKTILEIELDGI